MREACWLRMLTLVCGACAFAVPTAAAPSRAEIAAMVKADVAEVVAGINAHDPDRTTRFDAPDLVAMETLSPPILGARADRQGFAEAFKRAPDWRVGMIDEAVDVADAGDMAVYRSTYHEDSIGVDGAPMTHRVSFLAGFKHDPDGAWRMHWYVVCAQERSHKK